MSAECNSSVGATRLNIRKGVCRSVVCVCVSVMTVATYVMFMTLSQSQSFQVFLFNHCRMINGNGDSGRCLEHSV